jgi:hypothetical protein
VRRAAAQRVSGQGSHSSFPRAMQPSCRRGSPRAQTRVPGVLAPDSTGCANRARSTASKRSAPPRSPSHGLRRPHRDGRHLEHPERSHGGDPHPRQTDPVPLQSGHRPWPRRQSATRICCVGDRGTAYSGRGPGSSTLIVPWPRHLGHSGASSKEVLPLTMDSLATRQPVPCVTPCRVWSKNDANAAGLALSHLAPSGATDGRLPAAECPASAGTVPRS